MASPSKESIGLVSTTRFVVDPVQRAAETAGDGYRFLHFVDEGILLAKAEAGEITDEIVDWLRSILQRAVVSGVSRAVVTCSSLSPAVREAAEGVGIPVYRIDYPLYAESLKTAKSPAVVMTNPTTLEPSRTLIDEVIGELGFDCDPEMVLLEEAFARLNGGDAEAHDREVAEAIGRLAEKHDRILLAQISIARVRSRLEPELRERVASSLDFLPGLIRGEYR